MKKLTITVYFHGLKNRFFFSFQEFNFAHDYLRFYYFIGLVLATIEIRYPAKTYMNDSLKNDEDGAGAGVFSYHISFYAPVGAL